MLDKKFTRLHSITLLLSLLFLYGPAISEAAGETRYISDKISIYARAGAGTEFKLIAPLITGDAVTLLGGKKEDWVNISYGKNRQGWIQERFLTSIEPSAKRLVKANSKVAQLEQSSKSKIISLTETNKEYRKGNTQLLREVKSLRSKLHKVEKEYKSLREESATFLELQAAHKKLITEDQLRQKREATILAECELLKKAYRIKWFLAGGGILLIGFFIGLIMQAFRHRKKKGSGLSFK